MTTRTFFVLIAISVLLAVSATVGATSPAKSAAPGAIVGTITDADTDQPISGATITIPALGLTTMSGYFGEYFIGGLPDGQYTVCVSAPGYMDDSVAATVTVSVLREADFQLQPLQPQTRLEVTPDNRSVGAASGTTTFTVQNTAYGTMYWTAQVTTGADWLSIIFGASGTNDGTISVEYSANTADSPRTATIRVQAEGADNSPAETTVTQAGGRAVARAFGKPKELFVRLRSSGFHRRNNVHSREYRGSYSDRDCKHILSIDHLVGRVIHS